MFSYLDMDQDFVCAMKEEVYKMQEMEHGRRQLYWYYLMDL